MFLILVIIFGLAVQEWEIGDELIYIFALLCVAHLRHAAHSHVQHAST